MTIPASLDVVTAEQAALEAGCTSTWIRRLLKRGALPGRQLRGGTWLVEMKDVKALRETLTSRAVSKRERPKTRRKG